MLIETKSHMPHGRRRAERMRALFHVSASISISDAASSVTVGLLLFVLVLVQRLAGAQDSDRLFHRHLRTDERRRPDAENRHRGNEGRKQDQSAFGDFTQGLVGKP